MKRSAAVQLILVTGLAGTITACKEKRSRYCVDANNVVTNDDDCRREGSSGTGLHHWYYGGPGGYVAPGTRLSGGSASAPESETPRGVIGEAGEAAGHGAGEAGGHGGGGGE